MQASYLELVSFAGTNRETLPGWLAQHADAVGAKTMRCPGAAGAHPRGADGNRISDVRSTIDRLRVGGDVIPIDAQGDVSIRKPMRLLPSTNGWFCTSLLSSPRGYGSSSSPPIL